MLEAWRIGIRAGLMGKRITVSGCGMVVLRMIDLRRTASRMVIVTAMSHGCRSDPLHGNRDH